MGKLFRVDSRFCAAVWTWALAGGVTACDAGYPGILSRRAIDEPPSFGSGGSSFAGPVPMDDRPVITSGRVPPPVSGGTLLVLREGGRAVVADSDRDRLSFVDLENLWVESTLDLGAGAEPGRVVEGNGTAHVLLRGTGEVLTVDSMSHAVISRRAVCKAPRGIVFDPEAATVIVACLEGRLVELPAREGVALRDVVSEVDLRDLLLVNGSLFVTRFRSAELLELDDQLAVVQRFTLGYSDVFAPDVAWRAVVGPNSSIIVTHQRASTQTIRVTPEPVDEGTGASSGVSPAPLGAESSYGSSNPCSGIVESAVSTFSAGSVTTSGRLAESVLPVDIAVGPNGWVAIASAGPPDEEFAASISLAIYTAGQLNQNRSGRCALPDVFSDFNGPVVSVAFDPKTSNVVAQTREPAGLRVYQASDFTYRDLPLGGVSAYSTGHEMFHRDAGGGLACASCHPEGTDDGRVWSFVEFGLRRTQPLDVRLAGSAPFHWDGALADFSSLVDDVMVSRMSGRPQSPARIGALEEFLYQLRPRPGIRAANDPAALRGKTLFESERTTCAECHQGVTFTSPETQNIGKDVATQVPSLLGVSTRPPFMHDGCANTLRDRFTPECGGSRHGSLETLTTTELDDLVAYLETL